MSNILIIKHGSLGDIVQISGVLRDIRETYNNKKIFILTTVPYVELLGRWSHPRTTLFFISLVSDFFFLKFIVF